MATNLILTGGGIKSAVSAARVADSELVLLHIAYGQPSASSERKAVESFARTLPRARICRIELPYMRALSSGGLDALGASTGKTAAAPVSDDTAAVSPSVLRGLMPVLISVAGQVAIRIGAETITLGLSRLSDAAHVGLPLVDGRPDSHREFIHACDVMLELLLRPRTRVKLECPLMDVGHAEIIQLAHRFRVPLERTWSCLGLALHPCGKCAGCHARTSAFSAAGYDDPAVQLTAAS